jgi:hypothetical protein
LRLGRSRCACRLRRRFFRVTRSSLLLFLRSRRAHGWCGACASGGLGALAGCGGAFSDSRDRPFCSSCALGALTGGAGCLRLQAVAGPSSLPAPVALARGSRLLPCGGAAARAALGGTRLLT